MEDGGSHRRKQPERFEKPPYMVWWKLKVKYADGLHNPEAGNPDAV
jgi:hypothetical protein